MVISVAASATASSGVVAVAAETVCVSAGRAAAVVAVHKQKYEGDYDEPNNGIIEKIAQTVHSLTVPFRDAPEPSRELSPDF